MPSGGKRLGAGRKPGSRNKPKGEGRQTDAPSAGEGRQTDAPREARKAERVVGEIVTVTPILVPRDAMPREFLLDLMRNPDLPLYFRRDAAALALPYCHPKAVLGLKEARRLAALEDGDDELSAILGG